MRLLQPENYGAALIYFTGSKEHNVALRGRATENGLHAQRIRAGDARRGAARGRRNAKKRCTPSWSWTSFRRSCAKTAAKSKPPPSTALPELIELRDLRGDLQMHTTASDGRHSIEQMARSGARAGLRVHRHHRSQQSGDRRQWHGRSAHAASNASKIRAANAREPGIRMLAGIEVDILKDGSLDLADEVLAELDVVVASVHSFMSLERAAMTERMLAAIENPYTQIIGHPTGRLLLRRDAIAYDMERILDAARRHGVAMECNAAPDRLDLKDVYLRMAKERGVRVVISTDAHSTRGLAT